MEVGDMRVAQVSVDLANFYSDRVADVCKEKYGITQLLICASHTHEDPNMADARPREKKPDHTPFFEECIIKVVGEAIGNMFPRTYLGRHAYVSAIGFQSPHYP